MREVDEAPIGTGLPVPGEELAGPEPSRIDPSIGSLRRHTARGSLINSGFNVGLYALGTVQRIVVAIWLTREGYGFWAILVSALIALTWIKSFGIADKYIQQSEPDQEAAFQKAFTLEVCLSVAFWGLALIALPIYAVAYQQPQIIVPGIVLALSVPITAFEAPAWIPYRRLQYARQRFLNSVDPVSTAILSIALCAAGLGVWGLIIGSVAGSLVGAIVCMATSPYRFRFLLDWQTVKSYTKFSLPLFGYSLCGFVTLQGTLLVANHAVGLAGIGAIGLASNLTGMSDGVDAIVSQTIYPAVCAVAHRKSVLAEAFVKSNRIALMWAMPAMTGLALFAGDFIRFVLGSRWLPAVPLVAAIALTLGLAQIAFNFGVFLRAVNHTVPILVVALFRVVVLLVVAVPAMLLLGLMGYAVGFAAMTLSEVAVRSYYMHRLFGFSPVRQFVRAISPSIPAAAAVLALRALSPGHPSLARAIIELALFCATATAATLLLERRLVLELVGYLRGAKDGASALLGIGQPPEPAT
jgi:O-antigen/teichoic acid export membrane protein